MLNNVGTTWLGDLGTHCGSSVDPPKQPILGQRCGTFLTKSKTRSLITGSRSRTFDAKFNLCKRSLKGAGNLVTFAMAPLWASHFQSSEEFRRKLHPIVPRGPFPGGKTRRSRNCRPEFEAHPGNATPS